jgi:hypothetical protein
VLRSPATESSERVLVSPGEVKVACGPGVVLETVPLRDAFAVAVLDPAARVGGVGAVALDDATGCRPIDAEPVVRALIDSVLRMGGVRSRLVCATAGDPGSLAPWQGALAEKPADRVRRACSAGTVVLVLDLGAGRVTIAEATDDAMG